MTHSQVNDVAVMWQENDKNKRAKGVHITKLNVKKGVDFNVGDFIFLGKDATDKGLYWKVDEILEKRQSSMANYNYVTCNCCFTNSNI